MNTYQYFKKTGKRNKFNLVYMQKVFTELLKVPCLNSQCIKKKVCDTDSFKYSENLNEKSLTIQICKCGFAYNLCI